jgi:hypothetical protein
MGTSMDRQAINHPLQAIMSRTGSFPLRVAYNLLERYAHQHSVILDPFCGKGTTLLAARMLGHSAYGLDIAPEAVICSLAKLVEVNPHDLTEYLNSLPINHSFHDKMPKWINIFFHPFTLRQILNIRNRLIKDYKSRDPQKSANAVFILAILLGILHGHSSLSLSIASAHAFSMAPAYVSKFAAKPK